MSGVINYAVGALQVVVGAVLLFGPGSNLLGAAMLASGLGTIIGTATAPKPKSGTQYSHQEMTGNVRGTAEHHQLVFGRRRVGGVIVNVATTTSGSGSNANDLWIVIAHSLAHSGGCGTLQGVYVNEDYHPISAFDGSGVLQTGTVPDGGGGTTSAPYNTYLQLSYNAGTGTQAANALSTAAGVDQSTDYRRGVCYTVFKVTRPDDDAAFNNAWKSGIPQLNVVIDGIKCYDPRLDSTAGGSGSHRVANLTTWAVTSNPALIAATYQIMSRMDGGMGRPSSRVDWTSVATAANVCDQTITTPAGTQVRYACNVALSTEASRAQNLATILATMAGVCVRVGGVYKLYAGAYNAPSNTIDAGWLRGGIKCAPKMSLGELYNTGKTTFYDARQGWKQLESMPYALASAVSSDGDTLVRSTTLDGVTDPYQAQLLAAIDINRSRRQMTVELQLNLKGLDIEPWQTLQLDIPELQGTASKVFRVTSWRFAADAPGIDITAKEEDSAQWAAPSFAFHALSTPPGQAQNAPRAPIGLTASPVADGVTLGWTNSAGNRLFPALTSAYIIQRATASGGPWNDLCAVRTFVFADQFNDGATYWYRVCAINIYGTRSAYAGPISSKGKTVADGADVSSVAVDALLSNPGFEGGNTGWTPQTGWAITTASGARIGAYHAVFNGGTAAITNNVYMAAQPGDVIRAAGWLSCDAGTNGFAQVRVNFYNAAGSYLSSGTSSNLSPTTTYTPLRAVATAPAATAYAQIDVAVFSRTTGLWHLDSVTAALQPATLDEVPDSSTYGKTQQAALTSGQVDLSKSGTINRTLDYIADSATYARARAAALQNGRVRGVSQGANLVPNPGFEINDSGAAGALGTNADVADGWYVAVNSAGAYYLQRETNPPFVRSGAYALYVSLRNTTVPNGSTYEGRAWSDPIYVRGAELIVWSGWERGDRNATPPAGVTCYTRQGVIAYDAAGNQLTFDIIDSNSWTSTWAQRRRQWTIPAGAAYVRYNCTVYVVNASGSAFSTGANLYADARFDDVYLAIVQSIDDEIADGSTYARIASSELSSGVHKLRIAGSGARVGDQRNLVSVNVGSLKSQWTSLTISYSAAAGSPATATISASAGTLQVGSATVSYGASSAGVTGTGGTTATYYLYYRDPGFSGGTLTLYASTNGNVLTQYDDVIYVGAVSITFPTSGTGGGGGGVGGGSCVACESELPDGRIAAALVVGDRVLVADESTLEHDIGDVQVSRAEPQPCVRVLTASGAALVCSVDAPLPTSAGHCVDASCALGCRVAVWIDGVARWDDVTAVQRVGVRPVQYLTVGNRSFWAREAGSAGYILHHNIKAIP